MIFKVYPRLLILILLIGISGFKIDNNDLVTGMWQSLNDCNSVLKFTKDYKIILYNKGESFWGQISENGELSYTILKNENNWIDFQANDGDKLVFKGKIEIVTNDRIRVYFYKHHDILDVADEYYRTYDFHSFEKIMKKIMEN
jgi:hypothetical protein